MGAPSDWNETLLIENQRADTIEWLSSSVLDLRRLVKSNAFTTVGSKVLRVRKLSQYSDWMPLVMYGLYSLGCNIEVPVVSTETVYRGEITFVVTSHELSDVIKVRFTVLIKTC